jgi:hypothetical protein
MTILQCITHRPRTRPRTVVFTSLSVLERAPKLNQAAALEKLAVPHADVEVDEDEAIRLGLSSGGAVLCPLGSLAQLVLVFVFVLTTESV